MGWTSNPVYRNIPSIPYTIKEITVKNLDNMYNQLVGAGLGHQPAADYIIKRAKSKEEFLYGLKLLCDAHMEKPPYELPKLYQVQRAYHRYIRELFGVKSITEAIVGSIERSPVTIAKVSGENVSRVTYNMTKEGSVELLKNDQNIDTDEFAEISSLYE